MADLTLVKPEAPSALRRLSDDFLAHCRAKGLSPKTWRDAYRYALDEVFLPWCAEQGITEPAQLSTRVVERFTTHLLEDGGRRGPLSKASVGSYSRSVRAFLGWAEEEGSLPSGSRSPPSSRRAGCSTSSAVRRYRPWRTRPSPSATSCS